MDEINKNNDSLNRSYTGTIDDAHCRMFKYGTTVAYATLVLTYLLWKFLCVCLWPLTSSAGPSVLHARDAEAGLWGLEFKT